MNINIIKIPYVMKYENLIYNLSHLKQVIVIININNSYKLVYFSHKPLY